MFVCFLLKPVYKEVDEVNMGSLIGLHTDAFEFGVVADAMLFFCNY